MFVTVPEAFAPTSAGAFGRTPVVARIDGRSVWATSVWNDRARGTLLAVPRKQRGTKDHGETVEVEFRLDPSRF